MDTQQQQNSLSKVTKTMAIAFGVLFSMNALCTCITVAFVNATWEDMGTFKKFLTAIAILGNWTTVLMAFLSKTVARLEAGKSPIPTNGNGNGSDLIAAAATAPTPPINPNPATVLK
jgi:hypothetical protein